MIQFYYFINYWPHCQYTYFINLNANQLLYFIISMRPSDQKDLSGCALCLMITSTIILAAAAIALFVLLISWGNVGFIGSGSITLGTCTSAYYSTKYQGISQMNKTIFIGSCITIIISILLMFVIMAWACKIYKKQSGTKLSNGAVFLLISLNVLSSIPAFGYYLSFLLQINQCTSSTIDITNTIIILLLAATVLILSFLLLIVIACISSKDQYDQIQSSQTEPNENQHQHKQQASQYKPPAIKITQEYTRQKINYTRQNVYDSPSKRKIVSRQQYKQPKPQQRKYEPSKRAYLNPKENVIQNLHPNLKNIDLDQYVYANQKNRYEKQDQDSFKKYQKKYYDNDRRGILSRIDPEERHRQEEPRNRSNNRSPNRQYDRNQRSPNRNRYGRDDYERQPQRDRRYKQPRDQYERQPYPRRQYERSPQPDGGRGRNRDYEGSGERNNRDREGVLSRARNMRYRT